MLSSLLGRLSTRVNPQGRMGLLCRVFCHPGRPSLARTRKQKESKKTRTRLGKKDNPRKSRTGKEQRVRKNSQRKLTYRYACVTGVGGLTRDRMRGLTRGRVCGLTRNRVRECGRKITCVIRGVAECMSRPLTRSLSSY